MSRLEHERKAERVVESVVATVQRDPELGWFSRVRVSGHVVDSSGPFESRRAAVSSASRLKGRIVREIRSERRAA